MSLSHLDLAQVLVEVRRVALGARIEDAWLTGRALVLRLRRRSGTPAHLLAVAATGACRIHWTEAPPPRPQDPGPFAGVVRARLAGERIDAVEQRADDRVVTVHAGGWRLILELTDRTANMVLVEPDGTVVEALIRRRWRGIWPGCPYTPPRGSARAATAVSHPFTPDLDAAFPISSAIEAHYCPTEPVHRADSPPVPLDVMNLPRFSPVRRVKEAHKA